MPKNRKAKKNASDFQKVRHKVGRKVPLAANATNTAVKSKRIALPGEAFHFEAEETPFHIF